jgi:hypothetical protein
MQRAAHEKRLAEASAVEAREDAARYRVRAREADEFVNTLARSAAATEAAAAGMRAAIAAQQQRVEAVYTPTQATQPAPTGGTAGHQRPPMTTVNESSTLEQ